MKGGAASVHGGAVAETSPPGGLAAHSGARAEKSLTIEGNALL